MDEQVQKTEETQGENNIELPNDQEAMLSVIEARVLGALMEKQLTTPDAYPLTLNSLVAACNQKSSREPTMALEEGEVQHCLYQLQDRKLVEFEYGSRTNKFDQRLVRTLVLTQAEHAVFCLLVLRGPQTLNELFSRSKRMHEFENQFELEDLLSKHLRKLNPILMKIPQAQGQRECRYMHLLSGEPDLSSISSSKPDIRSGSGHLEARVTELEAQVAWLLTQVGSNSQPES